MKQAIILLLFTIAYGSYAQDSTRFQVTAEPFAAMMYKSYKFNPITYDLPAHYEYNSALGLGVKVGILHKKSGIGIDLLIQRYQKTGLDEIHTEQPNLPFMLNGIRVQFSQTQLSLAPYYCWLKDKPLNLNTGVIVSSITNTFRKETSEFMDGTQKRSYRYENQFNSSAKLSFGAYASVRYNYRHFTCSLFGAYEQMNAKYFSEAEKTPSGSLTIGLSAGYVYSF